MLAYGAHHQSVHIDIIVFGHAEYEENGDARAFAKRFIVFAQEHIKEPAAADALFWVVDTVRGRRETVQAIMLLEQHHAESEKMGPGVAERRDQVWSDLFEGATDFRVLGSCESL